jgi:DivIVA domain-containing protein
MAMRKDRVVGDVLGEETTISPSDLYNTDFKSSLVGGYDKSDVDKFLERVGDVFEALLGQTRGLREQIEQQRVQLDGYQEMEGNLRNALASAQKFSENLVDAARREAAAIKEQTKLMKAQAQQEARELPAALKHEIQQLRDARNRLRADLHALIEAHRALVGEIEPAEMSRHREAQEREEEMAPAPVREQERAALLDREPWLGED